MTKMWNWIKNKWRRFRKWIVGIFIGSAIAGTAVLGLLPNESVEPIEQEVISERTETTKHFLIETLVDGRKRYRGVTSIAPFHYKDNYADESEQWKDIDPTIELVNGKLQVTKAPYTLEVFQDRAGFRVVSKKDGSWVELTLDGNPSVVKATRVGNKVTLIDAFPNVDVEIVANERGVTLFKSIKGTLAKNEMRYTIQEKKGAVHVVNSVLARDGNNNKVTAAQENVNSVRVADHQEYTRVETFTPQAFRDDVEQVLSYPIRMDAQVSVGASSDDAVFVANFYDYNDTDTSLLIGRPFGVVASLGMRFLSLSIPSGATVDTATVTGVSTGFSGAPATIWYAEDSGLSPATFSSGSRPDQRTKTAASQTWTIPNVDTGVTQTSPSLVSLLQEVVDDWSGLTHLVIIVEDNTGSGSVFRDWASWDHATLAAPLVDYTYTAGGGGGDQANTQIID